jgi:hypothetical protein
MRPYFPGTWGASCVPDYVKTRRPSEKHEVLNPRQSPFQ